MRVSSFLLALLLLTALPLARANDALLTEFQQLTNQIASNYQLFLSDLDRWTRGTLSDEQMFQRVPPLSITLNQQFTRFSAITAELAPHIANTPDELQAMQALQNLGIQGAQGFQQWNLLFTQVENAVQQNDLATATQLLQQYYPTLLNGTVAFAKQLAALGETQIETDTIDGTSSPIATTATPSSSEQMLQMQQELQTQQQYYQTMSNINQMMHETNMSIINNMGSSGTTDYYENGAYIGSW